MQSPMSEENSGSTVIGCHNNGSNGDEDLFGDWQFISQSEKEESDDDSVEIIQRETPSPLTLTSDSELEEDDEEDFREFINVVPDEEIVTNQIQAIVPVHHVIPEKCQNRKEVVKSGSSYKILYSFFIGILASIVFQHYKNCIPNEFLDILRGNKPFAADTFSLSFPFTHMTSSKEEYSSPEYSSGRADDDLLVRLKNQIEKRRAEVDKIFDQQLNLLKHVQLWKEDAYVLNLSKMTEQSTKDNHINQFLAKTHLLMCADNKTSQQVPSMCRDIEDNDALLFLESNEITFMHDIIVRFLSDIERKAHTSLEGMLKAVGSTYSNHGVVDKTTDSDRTGADLTILHSRQEERDPEDEVTYLNKMAPTSESVFDVPESVPFAFNGIPQAAESVFDAPESKEDEDVKIVKKKWFDDLLDVVPNDWFLKLGEARERLRNVREMFRQTGYKNSRGTKSNDEKRYQWYKKTSEKFQGRLKSSFEKWKNYMKKMKDNLTHKFKDLKFKLKSKFQKQ